MIARWPNIDPKENYVEWLEENNKVHKYFYTNDLNRAKYSITLECKNYEPDAFVEEKDKNSKIHPRGKKYIYGMDSTFRMLICWRMLS